MVCRVRPEQVSAPFDEARLSAAVVKLRKGQADEQDGDPECK